MKTNEISRDMTFDSNFEIGKSDELKDFKITGLEDSLEELILHINQKLVIKTS